MIDKFEEYWRRTQPRVTEKTVINASAVKSVAENAYAKGLADGKKENEPFIVHNDLTEISLALKNRNIRKDIIDRVAIHVSRENYKELFSWLDLCDNLKISADQHKELFSCCKSCGAVTPGGVMDGMRIIIDD